MQTKVNKQLIRYYLLILNKVNARAGTKFTLQLIAIKSSERYILCVSNFFSGKWLKSLCVRIKIHIWDPYEK